MLVDQSGKLRPYNEFEALARSLNRQYNRNYLQAEWQTARTAAQMTEKWERLQETKHLFPNLKYRTVGDDRVRDAHARLDGIVKPIDDAFWDTWYPPSDWRCRCDVVATAEPVTQEDISDLPPPAFKNHVGKSGEVFAKNGGYFRLIAGDENALRNQELAKLNAPYEQVYKAKNGAVVTKSIFSDPVDDLKNFAATKTIADFIGDSLGIRPELNRSFVPGKNAEFLLKTALGRFIVGDRVSPKWTGIKSATENAFTNKLSKKRKGQLSQEENTFVAIETNFNPSKKNIEVFARASWSRFLHYKSLDFVYYYIEGKGAVKINRNIINSGFDFYLKTVQKLFKT